MAIGFAPTKAVVWVPAFAGTTIEPMEMMDRAVAVADTEAVGRGDRGADQGLGVAHGGFHRLAFGKAGGDRGGQRASGAVGVLGGDARRGQRDAPPPVTR